MLFIGRRRRRPSCSHRRRRDANGDFNPRRVASTGVVNHFYFDCYDDDFGPFFLKFCSYLP